MCVPPRRSTCGPASFTTRRLPVQSADSTLTPPTGTGGAPFGKGPRRREAYLLSSPYNLHKYCSVPKRFRRGQKPHSSAREKPPCRPRLDPRARGGVRDSAREKPTHVSLPSHVAHPLPRPAGSRRDGTQTAGSRPRHSSARPRSRFSHRPSRGKGTHNLAPPEPGQRFGILPTLWAQTPMGPQQPDQVLRNQPPGELRCPEVARGDVKAHQKNLRQDLAPQLGVPRHPTSFPTRGPRAGRTARSSVLSPRVRHPGFAGRH